MFSSYAARHELGLKLGRTMNRTPLQVARNLRAVDRPEDRKLLTEECGSRVPSKDVHHASAALRKKTRDQK